MGVMRFTVPPGGLTDKSSDLAQAYVSGFDGRVFPSRIEDEGDVFAVRRVNQDSGKLNIPFTVEGQGRPILSTSTLREQDHTYHLGLELARGKICQVRNQLAAWEGLGMQVTAEFRDIHKAAHQLFARAATSRSAPDDLERLASQAIEKACQAADLLTRIYIGQRLSVRLRRTPQLPVSFGCGLNCAGTVERLGEDVADTFNAACIPISWRQIEPTEGTYDWSLADALVNWCADRRIVTRGGPLLDLSPAGLPDWLSQWGTDFFNLQSFLCDFVETAMSRYQGRIRTWEIATRVNTGGAFNLDEEKRLSLLARTFEVARRVDEEAQLFLRIEDPWGAYQSQGSNRLSPIQFVDYLLRCGAGVSGVNLEITAGFNNRSSGPRDLLDFSRLIDQWSMLETPLHVTMAVPAAVTADPQSSAAESVVSPAWREPWSEQAQACWIDLYVPLLMSKQSVVGIYWNHLTDEAPHVFPNAGLIGADGYPRSGFDSFLKHRSGRTLD